MSSWVAAEGKPWPLGVSWIESEQAYNFALFSAHAENVTLLLYNSSDLITPILAYSFDYLKHKSGDIWHCQIPATEVHKASYYAYSVAGSNQHLGEAFDADKILLDPYAKQIYFPPQFDRQAAIRPGSNAGRAPLGVLEFRPDPFEWGESQVSLHHNEAIIYELHVRGFTQNPNSGVQPQHQGTYLGLIEKIPYLQELGITIVELMPIFAFDPQEGNFWGYMPIHFFSPHQPYASQRDPVVAKQEFRTLINAFHQAGIKVILDVVYNHTGEAGIAGPTYSFRGIDNGSYYILSLQNGADYQDFSGTGNSLNSSSHPVAQIIAESLRYWVKEMHVDGFRYDLASVLYRQPDGSIIPDPLLEGYLGAITELAEVIHIVEPWDAVMGGYLLGKDFPNRFPWQWNGKFRDDVRQFVKGDAGLVGPLMTRLYGSDDLFPDTKPYAYHPYQSVNYINSHDGFTLYDLVSYNQKVNWINGHGNTDGPLLNHSWNCGWEGDENVSPEVMALRKQQVKNFCCLLLLANGTPMFRAGDEFLQTQLGNNNPYNQDTNLSWLDWDRLQQHQDIFRFFRMMIAFRKAHPSISRSRFWREDVRWYGFASTVDFSHNSCCLAYCLLGASHGDHDLYVMINANAYPLDFTIQESGQWWRVINTGLGSPYDFLEPGSEMPLLSAQYRLAAHSIVVLIRS